MPKAMWLAVGRFQADEGRHCYGEIACFAVCRRNNDVLCFARETVVETALNAISLITYEPIVKVSVLDLLLRRRERFWRMRGSMLGGAGSSCRCSIVLLRWRKVLV